MSDKSKRTASRTRCFASVVYPESAPDNWIDILRSFHVNALISPLHDKDVNPDSGEIKKPHHHIELLFDGPKTREQAQVIFDAIGGVGLEVLNSVRGYARYLCHLDNPEKAQYSPDDVTVIGNEDYFNLISLPTDKYKNIREMIAFCYENNNFYYSDLLRYCMENRDDWFRTLCDNGTYVIKEFLKSENFKRQKESENAENESL